MSMKNYLLRLALAISVVAAAGSARGQLVVPPEFTEISVPAYATVGDQITFSATATAIYSDNSDGNDWNTPDHLRILRIMVWYQPPGGGWTTLNDWMPDWVSPNTVSKQLTLDQPGTWYLCFQTMDGRPWYSGEQYYSIDVAGPPVSMTPTATLTPSASSVLVGQTVSFMVVGSCEGGLNEIGLEGCDSGGTPTSNLGNVGVSGSSASQSFSWTPTAPGTYYFDGYAWNVNRSQLTRTGVISVTVISQTPTVTLSPSTTSAVVGQIISFTVAGGCPAGLNEIGFEAATASGQPTFNLGGVGASGTWASQIFSWSPTAAGTYYFVGYAWNVNRSELTRTSVTTVTVTAPPVITTHPASVTVNASQAVTLTVAASGTPTPTYQWRFNQGAIGGATSATFTLNNVEAGNAGNYDVVVTNSAGSVTSNTATVTVLSMTPSATLTSSTTAMLVGQTIGFTVTGNCAAGLNEIGFESCTVSGQPMANLGNVGVSGSSASQTFSWSPSGPGTYYFVGYAWNVNRSQLTRTSVRTVTVSAPPVISTHPASVTVNAGQNITLTVAASGSPAPSYQWRFNGGAIGGATNSSLILNNVQAAGAGSYDVVVSNSAGSVTSNAATVSVLSMTPTVTLTPSASAAFVGQAVNFTVVGNCPAGLNELGLEGCNASGEPTVNLGSAGASGGSASQTFSWSPTAPGTYYFVGYAWNINRSQLTRTGVITVTVTIPVSMTPEVTLTPSTTSVLVGQTVSFTVVGSCEGGLNEIGFEGCNASGQSTVNLGGVAA